MAGGGQTGTRKTAKLRLIQLKAKKLACFSQASNELIADGCLLKKCLPERLLKAWAGTWTMPYQWNR